MSDQRPLPPRPSRRPSSPRRTTDLRKPLTIAGAVIIVALVGYASTRKGPFVVGANSAKPVAVAATGVSPSAGAPGSPSPSSWGEDVIYPDLGESESPMPSASASTATPSPTAVPADWDRIVSDLTTARAEIFQAPNSANLARVDRPGSSAYRADDAARAALAERNFKARGLIFRIMAVALISRNDPIVVLSVRDRVEAYVIVDGAGRTVESRPARGPKDWRITIRYDQGQWRFVEIAAASNGR